MTKKPITWMELLKLHMNKDGKSIGFKEASKAASKEWMAIKNGTNSTYEQKIGTTDKKKSVRNKKMNTTSDMRMSRKLRVSSNKKSNKDSLVPVSQSLTVDNSNKNMIIRQIIDKCKLCSKCKKCILDQME